MSADDESVDRAGELRRAWKKWLFEQSGAWTHFVHLTFKSPPSETRALREWRVFIERAARLVVSRRLVDVEQVPWVMVIERHVSGDRHIHALIGGLAAVDPRVLHDLWRGTGAFPRQGFAKVLTFDPAKADDAFDYLLKHVGCDADVWPSRAAARPEGLQV